MGFITLSDTVLTVGETASVSFAFNEPVLGFDLSDVGLSDTSGTLADFTGSGRGWTATFTPTAGVQRPTNTITIRDSSYTDIDGNPGTGGASPNFVIDTKPPTVTVAIGDTSLIAGETATVAFTFSEPVTGFDLADVDLAGAAGALGDLAGTGATRTAVFTPTSGVEQAVNTITVKPGGYTDLAGNPGSGGSSAGFVVDTLAPTVAIAISDTALTRGETATVTVTFSEPVRGFDSGDIDIAGAPGTLSALSGTGAVRTAVFTPTSGIEQAVSSIAVKPGSYTDLAGNTGEAGRSAAFAVDTKPPAVTVAVSDSSLIAGETAVVTFTFSEPVTGFDLADVSLDGAAGTLGTLAGTGATRTAVFTPTAGVEQVANTIAVVPGGYTDLAGNIGAGGATPSFAVDARPPTVAIAISDTLLTRGETTTVTFTFSEAVVGFTTADIDLAAAAGTIAGLAQGDGNSWTATFTPTADFEQATNTIGVTAGSYTDIAGNPGAAAVSPAFRVDTSPAVPPGTLGPIAVDDLFAVNAAAVGEKGASLAVLANDVAQGAKLVPNSLDLVEPAENGEVTLKKGVIVYQPDPGFAGTELLSYTVQDKVGLTSNVALVTIDVTQPPLTEAVADAFTIDGATVGKKGIRLDILANDIPGFGRLDAKSVLLSDGPDDGTASLKKGTLVYKPAAGFEGIDEIVYTVADATGRPSDPAKVTITVTQPPRAQAVGDSFLIDAASISKNGARLDILVNDVAGFGRLDAKSVVVTEAPENGSVTVKKGVLLYTPDPGASGLDELRYTVADATGRPSNAANVTIDVRQPASLALADLLDDALASTGPTAPLATATTTGTAAIGLDTLVVAGEVS